jgi:hypothetical protein
LVSAFEIQDEVITDLLRPTSRGLNPTFTAEEGISMQAIHKETITDERELRRILIDACDNRASHVLPLGGGIDTSSAIFEFTLYQSEGEISSDSDSVKTCQSRLLVVDVPCTDPLAAGSAADIRKFEGLTLHKSLLTFHDVLKRLSSPSKVAIAPFRASLLTHYLSELLGLLICITTILISVFVTTNSIF